jgi:hypothetical protein
MSCPESNGIGQRKSSRRLALSVGAVVVLLPVIAVCASLAKKPVVELVVDELHATSDGMLVFKCHAECYDPCRVETLDFSNGELRGRSLSTAGMRRWMRLVGCKEQFEIHAQGQTCSPEAVKLFVAAGDRLKLYPGDEVTIAEYESGLIESKPWTPNPAVHVVKIRVSGLWEAFRPGYLSETKITAGQDWRANREPTRRNQIGAVGTRVNNRSVATTSFASTSKAPVSKSITDTSTTFGVGYAAIAGGTFSLTVNTTATGEYGSMGVQFTFDTSEHISVNNEISVTATWQQVPC